MQAIIIGAGRGARLMPTTADTPKCFAEVAGRRILDWAFEAFASNGVERICFIGGYRIETVLEAYPHFTFRNNADWPNNNILESLFHAADWMNEPFICCYSDTLFTPALVAGLLASKADISLSVDTDWLARYEHRSEHPPDDAEKVIVRDGVITRVERNIAEESAHGEFTGMVKFSARGAARLKEHYERCRRRHAEGPFREAKTFRKAFLIQLLQEMIEAGESMVNVDSTGQYIEIDTQQDFEYARRHWNSGH